MGASSGKESIQREIDSELQHIESIKREIEGYKTQLAREKGRKDVNLNSIKNIIESKKASLKRAQDHLKMLRERKKNA